MKKIDLREHTECRKEGCEVDLVLKDGRVLKSLYLSAAGEIEGVIVGGRDGVVEVDFDFTSQDVVKVNFRKGWHFHRPRWRLAGRAESASLPRMVDFFNKFFSMIFRIGLWCFIFYLVWHGVRYILPLIGVPGIRDPRFIYHARNEGISHGEAVIDIYSNFDRYVGNENFYLVGGIFLVLIVFKEFARAFGRPDR